MWLLLTATALANPPDHGASPAVAGLVTGVGSLAFGVPGAALGGAAWSLADPDCGASPCVAYTGRALHLGAPIGAAAAEVAGGVLLNHVLVHHGDGRIAIAGTTTALIGLAVLGAGWGLEASEPELSSNLLLGGAAVTVLAPPVVMGIMSGREAGRTPVARAPGLEGIGLLALDGGGGVSVAGAW